MIEKFDRKDVSPLNFWVHAILPLVYDDSLSYYEVLAKVSQKMNEVIEGLNANNEQVEKLTEFTTEQVENLTTAFNNFQASMLTRQEEFEARVLDSQQSFETQLTGDIANWEAQTEEKFRTQQEKFEETITNEQNTFKQELTDRQDEFEADITSKQEQFEQDLTTKESAFENSITTRQTNYETKITKQQNDYETSLSAKENNFEKKIETGYRTFADGINTRQELFESNMTTQEEEFQVSVNSSFETYKTEVDGKVEGAKEELKSEVSTELNGAKEELNSKYEADKQELQNDYNEFTTEFNNKIVQEIGDSETKIPSQKAWTEKSAVIHPDKDVSSEQTIYASDYFEYGLHTLSYYGDKPANLIGFPDDNLFKENQWQVIIVNEGNNTAGASAPIIQNMYVIDTVNETVNHYQKLTSEGENFPRAEWKILNDVIYNLENSDVTNRQSTVSAEYIKYSCFNMRTKAILNDSLTPTDYRLYGVYSINGNKLNNNNKDYPDSDIIYSRNYDGLLINFRNFTSEIGMQLMCINEGVNNFSLYYRNFNFSNPQDITNISSWYRLNFSLTYNILEKHNNYTLASTAGIYDSAFLIRGSSGKLNSEITPDNYLDCGCWYLTGTKVTDEMINSGKYPDDNFIKTHDQWHCFLTTVKSVQNNNWWSMQEMAILFEEPTHGSYNEYLLIYRRYICTQNNVYGKWTAIATQPTGIANYSPITLSKKLNVERINSNDILTFDSDENYVYVTIPEGTIATSNVKSTVISKETKIKLPDITPEEFNTTPYLYIYVNPFNLNELKINTTGVTPQWYALLCVHTN